MNKSNKMRTAVLATAILGAAALTVGADPAVAQYRVHGSVGGVHGSFHSGGWHGRIGHMGTWRGGNWRGGAWHAGTWRGAWNHRGWTWRNGRWWRPGVTVGFYGGYPYYDPYYYGGYYDGYYPYNGYYGDAYDSCDDAYGYDDYDDDDDCY